MASEAGKQPESPDWWGRKPASIWVLVLTSAMAIAGMFVACQGRHCAVPLREARAPEPTVDRPATATCLLHGRIYRSSEDEAAIAGEPIAVELSRFYIRSGMGMVSAYARAVAVTDGLGSFSLRVPQPASGTISRITVAIQQRTFPVPLPKPSGFKPSGFSDPDGAREVPVPSAGGRDPAEMDQVHGLPVFRMKVGAIGPHGGVATWEAGGPRPRARFACEWQLSNCSSD
jgi:hypothetical protein